MVAQFIFQLAGGPTGVADESSDQAAWPLRVGDGVLGRNSSGPAQTFFRAPPERREGQLVGSDWAALMHRKLRQARKLFSLQQVADGVAGGMVQNQPERTLVGAVLGEQDDGAMEVAFSQRRVCQQQLPLELNLEVGRKWIVSHVGNLVLASAFANRRLCEISERLSGAAHLAKNYRLF